jgi:hypothetical protein
MLRATKCLCTDRLGLRPIVAANPAMPSDLRMVRTALPGFYLLQKPWLKSSVPSFFMMLRSGTILSPILIRVTSSEYSLLYHRVAIF